jgi:uroporphyrinogen decarboxylase
MCNGRSNAVLEMIADSGADAVSPLERPPLGDVDIGDAARRVGKKLCLVGNVDPVNTMLKGTPEQLDAEIKGIIRDTGLATGLIVSTSDQVPLGVSEAMLNRFREAVAKYSPTGGKG